MRTNDGSPYRGVCESPREVDSADKILQFFEIGHLPEGLAAVERPYWDMAQKLAKMLPRNEERDVALRKLLESKDAARRAFFFNP